MFAACLGRGGRAGRPAESAAGTFTVRRGGRTLVCT